MEKWKWIPGYQGRYEVSNRGRVRTWLRTGKKSGSQPAEPKLMKCAIYSKTGYKRVCLTDSDGKEKTYTVHRLVLITFRGNSKLLTRHLNGIKTDNRLSNLAWGTALENSADMRVHGTNVNANKTHCNAGHLFDDENTRINTRGQRVCRKCDAANARGYRRRLKTLM